MLDSIELSEKITNITNERPELVAVLLERYGYKIDFKDRSLLQIIQQLNKGIYTLLFNGNKSFSNELASLIVNEGYSNFEPITEGIAFVASLGSALITAFTGKSIAKKQRELQDKIALADRASAEKMASAKLATVSETERVKMIADSIIQYRISQQSQATLKINDTWIFVVGLGGLIAISYGIFLIIKKKNK